MKDILSKEECMYLKRLSTPNRVRHLYFKFRHFGVDGVSSQHLSRLTFSEALKRLEELGLRVVEDAPIVVERNTSIYDLADILLIFFDKKEAFKLIKDSTAIVRTLNAVDGEYYYSQVAILNPTYLLSKLYTIGREDIILKLPNYPISKIYGPVPLLKLMKIMKNDHPDRIEHYEKILSREIDLTSNGKIRDYEIFV